jgi:hypothetical protein
MDIRQRYAITTAITAYDRRQEKRKGYNPYALAHYCGAAQGVEAAVDAGQDLRAAILEHFLGRLCDHVLLACGLPTMTREEARR